MPGPKQAWPTVAACWSPATPRIGISRPKRSGRVMPKGAAQSRTSGSSDEGDVEESADVLVPPALGDVVDQGARGVGGVGGVDAASGQVPDQPGVDGAEGELAGFGPRPRALDVVEEPLHLGPREVGVEKKAGAGGDHRFVPGGLQGGAGVGGAAVLPDDGGVDRLAGLAVPDQRRLALVGDADGGDVGGLDAGLLDRGAGGAGDGGPEVGGVVFDPAGAGVVLGKLFLGGGDRPQGRVEEDRAGGGGALVDGKDMGHLVRPARDVSTVDKRGWSSDFNRLVADVQGFLNGLTFAEPAGPGPRIFENSCKFLRRNLAPTFSLAHCCGRSRCRSKTPASA